MHTPKSEPLELTVFKSGNSAALRLPKALGFEPGERIVAYRDGEALVLKHADAMGWPVGYFDSWEPSTIELPERFPAGSREARMQRLFGVSESF
ncbi:MAG: AbrB/MazE/SpoVT family DNA-binding domain-containing protein [Holophagaceae bacterium]|nr:AbrB/MazE/SpoVT family DNA-binding domain-containing protein [Holophagaceae bacterium]